MSTCYVKDSALGVCTQYDEHSSCSSSSPRSSTRHPRPYNSNHPPLLTSITSPSRRRRASPVLSPHWLSPRPVTEVQGLSHSYAYPFPSFSSSSSSSLTVMASTIPSPPPVSAPNSPPPPSTSSSVPLTVTPAVCCSVRSTASGTQVATAPTASESSQLASSAKTSALPSNSNAYENAIPSHQPCHPSSSSAATPTRVVANVNHAIGFPSTIPTIHINDNSNSNVHLSSAHLPSSATVTSSIIYDA